MYLSLHLVSLLSLPTHSQLIFHLQIALCQSSSYHLAYQFPYLLSSFHLVQALAFQIYSYLCCLLPSLVIARCLLFLLVYLLQLHLQPLPLQSLNYTLLFLCSSNYHMNSTHLLLQFHLFFFQLTYLLSLMLHKQDTSIVHLELVHYHRLYCESYFCLLVLSVLFPMFQYLLLHHVLHLQVLDQD